MENKTLAYRRLGGKTLLVFILRRSPVLIFLLVLLAMLLFSAPLVPVRYGFYLGWAALALLLMAVIWAVAIFALAWLQYTHYGILLDEESFKVTRGLISEEQIGVPLARIKEASIKRGVWEQLFGVSRLILTILGEYDKEENIVLPALDKKIAATIQDFILRKAGTEELTMEPAEDKNENKI
ncbi:MAG TPA: PH domain-containing protein [Candidatus Methylomirabilis sp.]|nr:PH domain-containing protein [Candidatus Methylomirabilis sp.]